MLEDLRQEVCDANRDLQRLELVILTWGNVSGLDAEQGLVAIKPSGVGFDAMRPEHMVIVDLEGRVVEGDLRPSSDLPTHLALYRACDGVRGVAHTHSPYATAWAQARRPLPCYGTTHADTFHGPVPVTADLTPEAVAGDYERATGEAIVAACLAWTRVPAALVAGHGPFTWGPSPAAAVAHSLILEQVAQMALLTEALAPGCPPLAQTLQDRHFQRKHGPAAYYGQGE